MRPPVVHPLRRHEAHQEREQALALFQAKWKKELAHFQAKRKQELEDGQMAVELHKKEVQLANQGGGGNFPVTESFRAVDEGGDGNCVKLCTLF